MKLFLMKDPKLLSEYARFSHVGTWTKGELCVKCGQPTSKLVQPLQIEWEPGAKVIGDFSWCGFSAVVTIETGAWLQKEGFDVELGEVSVVESPHRDENLQVYPSDGKVLKWLQPIKRLPLNEVKSNIQLLIDCDVCNQRKYSFKKEGLFIDKDKFSKEKIFCIQQFTRSNAIFVTEEAVKIIQDAGLNNVEFINAGAIE